MLHAIAIIFPDTLTAEQNNTPECERTVSTVVNVITSATPNYNGFGAGLHTGAMGYFTTKSEALSDEAIERVGKRRLYVHSACLQRNGTREEKGVDSGSS